MRPEVRIAFTAMTLAVLPVLASCNTTSKPNPPTVELRDKFAEGTTIGHGAVDAREWWKTFKDSRLNDLVERGLVQNLDVQQALERINAAESGVTAAGAGALPSLVVSASNTVSETNSENTAINVERRNTATGGARLSWLLDFFGLYRQSRESAMASLDEAHARVDVARLALLSQTVSAYIDLRYQEQRLAIANRDLASRRETLNLTRILEKQGQSTKVDIVQAQGLASAMLAQIPAVEVAAKRASYRLETLVGGTASGLALGDGKAARQPMTDDTVQAGVPADLLRNRPDIRAAERRLAAAVANIGVAEAQLYPSITLGGSISPSSLATGGLTAGAVAWSFGPTLNLPIFDGGKLRANLNIAESNAKEAYLAWKSTVLSAVEEVQGALAAVRRDNRTVSALRDTVRFYRQALELSTVRYRQGETSLFEVLDAQRSISDSQRNYVDAVRQVALNYVALNVAIGSGYFTPSSETTASIKASKPVNTPASGSESSYGGSD